MASLKLVGGLAFISAPSSFATSSTDYHDRHQPAMKLMRWGLIPSWAKDESVGNAHINARSETLPSRNAFREEFKHRRCLIPADSFYEERGQERGQLMVMSYFMFSWLGLQPPRQITAAAHRQALRNPGRGRVVCARTAAANFTLAGSPLRRAVKSCSCQPMARKGVS